MSFYDLYYHSSLDSDILFSPRVEAFVSKDIKWPRKEK